MVAEKPKLIVTRKLPDAVEAQMAANFDAELNGDDTPLGRSELAAAFGRADVIVPTVSDVIDAEIIGHAGPNLKLLANFGVGVNHIDLDAARAKGIAVTNTPDVLTEDTADLAMALILMAARRLGEGERMLRGGGWTGWAPTQHLGRRVNGAKLGIIGMGRIGAALGRRARGFGMRVHYHNRGPVEAGLAAELAATYWDDLDAMIGAVDILSVNCPLSPETHHLLSAERLALLQPHAFVVNASRGGIIDEAALADALKSGAIAGAGLDVFEGEPAVHASLLGLENVVLLPHLGSATLDGRIDMGMRAMANVEAFLAGETPPDLL
ncbi:MAG: D-glycerate dehydrogenase [Rhodospirillaceae bacterium]|nr:D-glycerate dehydrogenase [Rhodospirillaceae bacterium]